MKRFMSLLAISLISTNVGCTVCSNCNDYTYGAFGGLWERSDLTYGRVGSAFSPQGVLLTEGEVVAGENQEEAAPEAETIAPPAEDAPPRFDAQERSLLET